MSYDKIVPVRSKIEPIPVELRLPHYNDRRFTGSFVGRTIFLAEGVITVSDEFGGERVEGAFYNYDSNLHSLGETKLRNAKLAALAAVGGEDTAAYHEAMLQHVYDDPTTRLEHIVAGVEESFPYLVYGTVSSLQQ